MIHYGDITQIKGSDVPIVDIVTGGSPCQDLSVAGKRAGLAGERSGLFMEQIRIIKEMREHDRQRRRSDGRADEYIRPRYMVWENVPGAFSSNGGKDFHAVLEETAKVAERDASIPGFEGKWPSAGCIMGNGWSIAWRVHDAQFWGVPQRRKRIALVADFGGETAPEILFERKSVSGDIAQGGKEGEGTSGDAERCAGTAGTEPIVLDNNQNDASIHQDGICNTLPAAAGMGGGYVPMITGMAMQAIGEYKQSEAASSLKMRDYKDATDLVVSYGLDRAAKGPNAVDSFYPQMKAESQCWREDDISNTLVNGTNPGFQNGICTPIVRRLTPLECERLQGYPDYWTDIGDWVDSKGKTHKGDSDSPRYKALGNSIALPFWSWMAGRMVRNLRPGCTMASLFDGIGGFPFVFLGWGCEPVWASEIEEFPIAVTKFWFPETEN